MRPFKPLLAYRKSNKTNILEMYYVLLTDACQTFRQNPRHLAITLAKNPVQKNILHAAIASRGRVRIVDKDYHFAQSFLFSFGIHEQRKRCDLVTVYKLFRIPQSYRKT